MIGRVFMGRYEIQRLSGEGGMGRVYLARPRGFCAGVVMAIEAVERWAEALKEKGELVVYHEIVQNRVVVERLQA